MKTCPLCGAQMDFYAEPDFEGWVWRYYECACGCEIGDGREKDPALETFE